MDFFSLSKSLWANFHPIQMLMYLLLIGLIINFFNKNKIFKIINLFTFILFISIIFLPNGTYLLWKLENAYSKPETLPGDIDGILILGGGTDPFLTYQHNQIILTGNIERITKSVELIKRFPNAKVVYTGGTPVTAKTKFTGIEVAKMFYKQMGIDINQIVYENKSRNTYENFIFSKKFINNTIDEKWILLTSASHMKRAMSVAEKLKLNFIPYPVDYNLQKNYNWKRVYIVKGRAFLQNLNNFNMAAHEYVGLIVYYLTKKSSKMF